ncbi:MAG: hypothetical protein IB616_05780 [Methanosarcinales archaeon]|nr:MAG: hypothetical protein IB616_05780 [Methanosarcinales archaeon]
MKYGTRAKYTGIQLEKVIYNRLSDKGYSWVDKKHFDPTRYLEQPIFSTQYHIGKSIYETDLNCDFIIYHPEKHPNCLIIESKWQESTGSVDEKFPYLVANIKEKFPCPSIVVLDGGGYKSGAEKWLRNQTDEKKTS